MSLDDTIKPDDWRDVKIPTFTGINLRLSADNLENGELSRAENVRVVDDLITRSIGYIGYHTTVLSGEPMSCKKFISIGGAQTNLLFTTTTVYRDNGVNWIPISGVTLTGSLLDRFSIVQVPWADQVVFTNGIDKVQVWDFSTDTIAPLGGFAGGVICKSLAIYDSSLWLLNVTEGATQLLQRARYSDKANITEWVNGVAGFIDLFEGTEQIICGRQLGSYLIIYRERGIHRVSISSNPNKRFEFDQMIPDNGVSSIDSVADIERNKHIIWGKDNIYRYDGGFEIEPIGDDIQSLVFGTTDTEHIDGKSIHHFIYFEEINELLGVYRASGDSDLLHGLIFRTDEEAWTTRVFTDPVRGADKVATEVYLTWNDLIGDWDAQVGSWNDLTTATGAALMIFASSAKTYEFDPTLENDDDAAIIRYIDTKDFSEYPMVARLDWIDIRIFGPDPIDLYYSLDEGAVWTLLRNFDPSATPAIYRIHQQIIYESIRFRLQGNDLNLYSMNLRVTPEAEYGTSQSGFAVAPFVGPFAPVLTGSVV